MGDRESIHESVPERGSGSVYMNELLYITKSAYDWTCVLDDRSVVVQVCKWTSRCKKAPHLTEMDIVGMRAVSSSTGGGGCHVTLQTTTPTLCRALYMDLFRKNRIHKRTQDNVKHSHRYYY